MKLALDALNAQAEHVVWRDPAMVEAIDVDSQVQRFESNLNLQLANCTLPGELELTSRLRSLWQEYKHSYQQLGHAQPGPSEFYRLDLLPRYQAARQVAQQLADMNMGNMVSVDGRVRHTLIGVRRALWVLVLVGILLALSLIGTVGATILRPLRTLILSARQIESGNLDLSMPVGSHDEVGQLTEAFNSMASRLREFKQLDTKRLLHTQQITQLAIDSLHDAVIVIGPTGIIEISNRAAQTHFKILAGKKISELRLKWLSDIFAQVSSTNQSVEPQGYSSAIQLFDGGKERFLLPRAVPMQDPGGKTIGVAVVLVDVTRLRHADELKSGLLSTVSHELRTPLTALRMAVSMLHDEKVGELNSRQRTLVKTAHQESERLFEIIENLLNISRIESGRTQFHFQPVAPASIIEDVVAPLRGAFAQKGIELQVAADAQVPQINADPAFIGHALLNLISNAMKFTPSGGKVVVSAEQRDGQVTFAVADTGPGIRPQYAERVFQKFFRIPHQNGPSGVGLGLAIAKEIVEAHGGSIHFHNRESGGCEFHLTLPLLEKQPSK
jgi:signal transduction histidine kinase